MESDSECLLVAENYPRFKKNLEENYDLKYEEYHIDAEGSLIKPVREWSYCGRDSIVRFKDKFSIDDVGEICEDANSRYFKLYFKGNPPKIPWESHCVCGVSIVHNHYITDDEGRILVVGRECIKNFIVKSGRICEDCGAKHKCQKQNKCTDCAKKCKKDEKEQLRQSKIKKKFDEELEFLELKNGLSCDKCTKAKQKKYQRCFDCNEKYKNHPKYK
jgi:hypothetical protein